MSTLNYNNYENHRPHSQIYQNKEIVPEPSPNRKTLVIIGTSGGQMDPKYYKGLVLIDSLEAISKKLLSNKTEEDEVVTPSTDNLLYEAAQIAFTAGGGQAFYVLDVGADDTDKTKWQEALKILSNSDRSMFIAPLTYNVEISNLVKKAALDMSSPDNQKWKRVYQGVPACSIEETESTEGIVTDNLDEVKLTGNALVEAIIKSNRAYSLLGEDTLQRSINIWTAGSIIYTTNQTTGALTEKTLSNMMVAVGIAAYRASILVQQGLSMKPITWIAGIPNNYLLFDKDDLNKIAVGASEGTPTGVMIIAQDDADNEVYVRHQLTSDLTRGIMYYEDSVGVNVDAICYGIKDIVRPYLGQRNNTDETLVEIKNRVIDYLLELTNTGVSIEARRIGPQIKSVDLESVLVILDGDLKDRVNIQFDVEIPLPINTIRVHVNAYADLNNR
jgi:hypothetical protein